MPSRHRGRHRIIQEALQVALVAQSASNIQPYGEWDAQLVLNWRHPQGRCPQRCHRTTSSETLLGEQEDLLTVYPQTHPFGVDTDDTLVLTRTLPLLELSDELSRPARNQENLRVSVSKMDGQDAVQRRMHALQQHLTAASVNSEKAPHVAMNGTSAQTRSIWQDIPQVDALASLMIAIGFIPV